MPDTETQMAPATPVVETASATTSPDNANSGYAAYLIAAGGLAVAMLLAWSLASSVLGIVGMALSDYASSSPYGYGDTYDLDDLDDSDRQQLIEDLIHDELDQRDEDMDVLPDSFGA